MANLPDRTEAISNILVSNQKRDAHSRLRDALRDEKLKSMKILDTCRELEKNVNTLKNKLKEAETREKLSQNLASELSIVRQRADELNQQRIAYESNSSTMMISQSEEDKEQQHLKVEEAQSFVSQLQMYFSYLLLGFILLIIIVLFAFLTLWILFKTTNIFMKNPNDYHYLQRTVY